MQLSILKKAVRAVMVIDVLLAASLITTYVYLLAENLQELELIPGSKTGLIIDYASVAFTCIVQILVALKLHLTLSDPPEEDNLADLLRISRLWLVASYILLLNWLVKAAVYSQRHKRRVSGALAFSIVEVSFRIFAIIVVKIFVHKLRKIYKTQKQEDQVRQAKQEFANRMKAGNKNTP